MALVTSCSYLNNVRCPRVTALLHYPSLRRVELSSIRCATAARTLEPPKLAMVAGIRFDPAPATASTSDARSDP